jgi:hypothetical protein
MRFMPPAVVALLLVMCAVAGIVMMFGMRIAMRRDLEPLSRSARWMLVAMLAIGGGGGWIVYRLAAHNFAM